VDRFLSRCAGEKQKTPTGQTEAKTMEYQRNHNSNSASTASNGTASSITSNTASGSENRKPATAQQLVRENVQFLIQQLAAPRRHAKNALPYIHLYHGNAALLAESLELVQQTAAVILAAVESSATETMADAELAKVA
jgi:hypothetical protein